MLGRSKRAGEYPCRHAARAVGGARRAILPRELWRDGAAVAGIHIPQGCSIWMRLICPVARLNMHAGVSGCHQRRDGCVLSRPSDHTRVNLGERVQRVFVKLNTPIERGLRVCPFES